MASPLKDGETLGCPALPICLCRTRAGNGENDTKAEGFGAAPAGGRFPRDLCPSSEHCHQPYLPPEQMGKLRPGEKERLLREQPGAEGRAENRSRFPDTPTPRLPCQVLVLQQTRTQGSGRGCQGHVLGSPHPTGVTRQGSQGSPPSPICGPFRRPGAGLSSQNPSEGMWLGLPEGLQTGWSTGGGLWLCPIPEPSQWPGEVGPGPGTPWAERNSGAGLPSASSLELHVAGCSAGGGRPHGPLPVASGWG